MSVTDFLKKAYPFLTIAAQAVPGGSLVTSALGQILRLKSGDTMDAASLAVMNAPPEVRAQLQAEENRHAEAMNQMGIGSAEEFEKIMATDRADARKMQITTHSWMPGVLAIIAVATLALCIYMVGFRTLQPSGHDAMLMLLGTVVAIAKDVYGYVFGSSAGSDRKTDLMAEASSTSK
jgi:hypothetical protein